MDFESAKKVFVELIASKNGKEQMIKEVEKRKEDLEKKAIVDIVEVFRSRYLHEFSRLTEYELRSIYVDKPVKPIFPKRTFRDLFARQAYKNKTHLYWTQNDRYNLGLKVYNEDLSEEEKEKAYKTTLKTLKLKKKLDKHAIDYVDKECMDYIRYIFYKVVEKDKITDDLRDKVDKAFQYLGTKDDIVKCALNEDDGKEYDDCVNKIKTVKDIKEKINSMKRDHGGIFITTGDDECLEILQNCKSFEEIGEYLNKKFSKEQEEKLARADAYLAECRAAGQRQCECCMFYSRCDPSDITHNNGFCTNFRKSNT